MRQSPLHIKTQKKKKKIVHHKITKTQNTKNATRNQSSMLKSKLSNYLLHYHFLPVISLIAFSLLGLILL